MKMPKNGIALGLITFIISAAISLIAKTVLTTIIAAGIVGYQYTKQYKQNIVVSQKIIASLIPGIFHMSLLLFQYYVKDQKEILQLIPDQSIHMNALLLFLSGFVLQAILMYLGFILGEKIGKGKELK